MRFLEIARLIAFPAETGNVSPFRIEVVNETRTVSVTDKEVPVGQDGGVRRMVLAQVGILGGESLRAGLSEFFSVWGTHRHDLSIVISNPETILAVVIGDRESMGSRKARFPRGNKFTGLAVGNEIIVSVVRQHHDPTETILLDAVTVLDRIFMTIQPSPEAMSAVAEISLAENLAVRVFTANGGGGYLGPQRMVAG